MKQYQKLILLLLICIISTASSLNAQIRQIYQLKIYTFETEAQEKATDDYLENALLPALTRQMIEVVGVFKNRKDTEADSIRKTYVLIPFISLFQYKSLEQQMGYDLTYLEDGKAFINATYDNPSYSRIESILLNAFEDMPMLVATTLEGPRADRIYELRSYESATEKIYVNKMEMFNAGGEIQLFKDLDFHPVFFGEVIAGPNMPNLMYMTTHKNKEEQDQNWKKFVDSEGWKEMSSLEKYQNNVSHIDKIFLYPTPYSSY